MADKEAALAIVVRMVDRATAGVRAINKRIDEATRPTREFGKAISELGEKSGFNAVADGIGGVGAGVNDLIGKLLLVGGVTAAAGAAVMSFVGEFDDLGDISDRLGVTADFLASMGYAAEKTGAPVDALNTGMEALTANLGQARAGTGRMTKFLEEVSPPLLAQLKATKSSEAAFRLLADAMSKLKDPAKRAALAQKTVGDAALAPMLALGSQGLLELQGDFVGFAGSLENAVEGAGKVDDSMHDLGAATKGVKAALVTGLSPALEKLIKQLTDWLVVHRPDVERWAKDIGERLPGAVDAVVHAVEGAVTKVTAFIDSIGGLKVAGIAAAAMMTGPLLSSFVTLGAAMLSTPFGAVMASLAAMSALVITVTGEIERMVDAMDTTREEMLQDSVSMTPEQFHAKYPQLKGKSDDTLALWDSLAHPAHPEKTWSMFDLARSKEEGGTLNPFDPTWNNAFSHKATDFGPVNDVVGAGAPAARPAEARIKIDITGAPPGTRATADPQNTANVDLSVGHQLGGGW